MIIRRGNNTVIKKRKIDLRKLDIYDEKKITKAKELLEEAINESYVCHFENITYALNSNNKDSSFFNKHSGCTSQVQELKKMLKRIGIKTYYVSCKANGFSTPNGDLLVKEAHVFLIYPTLKNNKIFFIIFDPGFRQKNIISFYDMESSCDTPYLETGINRIIYFGDNNSMYPYELYSNKRITCDYHEQDANIHWLFNPYYETIDLNNYSKELFHAIFSLKMMNFPKKKENYLCIRSKVLDNTLEIFTYDSKKTIFFKEIKDLSKVELHDLFKSYFTKANLSEYKLNIFSKNLYLLIHHCDEYINKIIDKGVIEDYKVSVINR